MRFAGGELLDARAELQEVRREMEEAVDRILASAEAIVTEGGETMRGHGVAVMEACGVNDLVGQRIGKVSALLAELDDRLRRLASECRVSLMAEIETDAERRRRELILNGPPLTGATISQADIDSLFE